MPSFVWINLSKLIAETAKNFTVELIIIILFLDKIIAFL